MNITLTPMTEETLQYVWHWNFEVKDPEWKLFDAPYFDRPPYVDFETFKKSPFGDLSSSDRRIIEVDGEAAGIVTRYEEAPMGGGWWEIGIIIFDPQHWSRGIGRDALTQWVNTTFEETGAHLITLTTWSGNERMVLSAARVGFTECGRVPEAREWEGQRYDSVRMAVLHWQWEDRA